MFLVKPNWKKLNKTVWSLLEKRRSAPADMYIELLRFARRRLGIQVDEAADEALHSPSVARERFFDLPEPRSELKCIELLEGFYDILREFMTAIADAYRQEVREFVEEYNLRYMVSDDCRFRLSIEGLLVSQYAKLRNALSGNPHIQQSLEQLEHSVWRLKDTRHEERNCIGIATNFLEGIACVRTTNNQPTLSAAIDGCNVFPHPAVRQCIKQFYKFASDYPNIRHGHPGTPANRLRELKRDDALLAVYLAVGFGSYVFDNDSADAILEGEL